MIKTLRTLFFVVHLHLVCVTNVFSQSSNTIAEGKARFMVLSPVLVRMEYSGDSTFEDSNTFNVVNRKLSSSSFSTRVEAGWRVIETDKLKLNYKQGSGPFTPSNLSVVLKERNDTVYPIELPQPDASSRKSVANNLGGWSSTLDGADKSIPLADGLLTKEGWYLLDDSKTELWSHDGWIKSRIQKEVYQDGYFFGYGTNYKEGLRLLSELTGKAPLLPRWAFGIWFSRYCHFSDKGYQEIVGTFRSKKTPLDVLVIDTDFKSPNSWDGWGWNTRLFPNPAGFMNWTAINGLKVTFNIHADIMGNDPKFPLANQIAKNSLINQGNAEKFSWIKASDGRMPVDTSVDKYTWDWKKQEHATSFFSLHDEFEKDGVDFWWLDAWCDVNWVNHLYAKRMLDNNKRPIFFGRTRGSYPWAEKRSTIHFTGDTKPTWELLNFIPYYTIREGNIGMSYITHDIGSHLGVALPDDYYIRWVQLGTFLPILRLHSSQCNGIRLPWEYRKETEEIATRFLRLRHALIPYLYTIARETYDIGLPMVRGMYLDYPKDENAYTFDRQYMFGSQMLVAPVTASGDTVSKEVWFPDGMWFNLFTGETYNNAGVQKVTSTLQNMPVFVKAGGIVPLQPYMDYVGAKSVDTLICKVFPGANGSFELYEDNGENLEYQKGSFSKTLLEYSDGNVKTFTINASTGTYSGRLVNRAYVVAFSHVEKPASVTINGSTLPEISHYGSEGWVYDTATKTLTVTLSKRSVSTKIELSHNGKTIQVAPR